MQINKLILSVFKPAYPELLAFLKSNTFLSYGNMHLCELPLCCFSIKMYRNFFCDLQKLQLRMKPSMSLSDVYVKILKVTIENLPFNIPYKAMHFLIVMV